jgi:hypothetical protein
MESPDVPLPDIELLSLPEVADALALPITRVHQHIRDGQLVEMRDDGDTGVRRIPAAFVQDGQVVKSLPAVITLLRDGHYEDAEIIDWLFRVDDTLPGSPIEALRANRGTEVKRRAQVAGF